MTIEIGSGITIGGGITIDSTVNASGGTITTFTSGGLTYRLHTFTANSTFSVSSPGWVEVFVVGGGGGGGAN